MSDAFFEKPILNSPYYVPRFHWELDENGQPTERTKAERRKSSYVTPAPKPKRTRNKPDLFESESGTEGINDVRSVVSSWRDLKSQSNWGVTAETARLIHHWRHYNFQGIRPFFCQVEAADTGGTQ